MPRTARLIIPQAPHHVIQRGNRRMDVFFHEADYKIYLNLLKDEMEKAQTAIIAYCLMPNHVHLILQPSNEIGLRKIGEVHRLYTRYINRKMEWSGYLWQGRFGSYPMDDAYLYNALRYIELNPVFAGLCVSPEQYRWSSARQRIYFNSAHDLKTAPAPFTEDWKTYWKEGLEKHHIMQEIERNTIEQTPKLAGGTQ